MGEQPGLRIGKQESSEYKSRLSSHGEMLNELSVRRLLRLRPNVPRD